MLLCQSLSHISYNLAIMECRVLWSFMRGCRMSIKFRTSDPDPELEAKGAFWRKVPGRESNERTPR